MTKRRRITLGGYVYHVLNRANGRLRIFRKVGDFLAFEQILAEGLDRVAMRLCGYCLMGNHWHLLLWPRGDGDLSDFLRWVTLTHTQRYHVSHGTVGMGHLYQGRFKSFPVQDEGYYLTALRYIEGNPVRAALVQEAGQWPWSSFAARQGRDIAFALDDGPIELPSDWVQLVHEHFSDRELTQITQSVKRGSPLGDQRWTQATAAKLKLEPTLRPRGRPRKQPPEKKGTAVL